MFKKEIFPSSISSIFILSLVLFYFNFSFISATEVILQGKLGEDPTIQFSSAEREVKLICDLNKAEVTNNTKPKWSFMQHGKVIVEDVALRCNPSSTAAKSENPGQQLLSDCEVSYDKSGFQTVLKLDDIRKSEFGNYVCHTGNMSRSNKTFILKELVQLSRKNAKGKIRNSVTVTVGDPLFIYCNQTGFQPNKHEVSWWFDSENITGQLNNGLGLFENFTKTDNLSLSYTGAALMKHRGNYTCQVDLKIETSDDQEIKKYYPRSFAFFVRVKEGDEWHLPLYILVGECLLIGVFTLIVNWREKRLEDDDSVVYEDSEDEDDVPNPSNSNGTQNNNSNGK